VLLKVQGRRFVKFLGVGVSWAPNLLYTVQKLLAYN
jgi:hypothetical protein